MAAACESGCPWGELGDFVKESMKPLGYSVILCRNCNRWYGSRLVSEHDYPPPLDEINLEDGVNVRVDARVDFGGTSERGDSIPESRQEFVNVNLRSV